MTQEYIIEISGRDDFSSNEDNIETIQDVANWIKKDLKNFGINAKVYYNKGLFVTFKNSEDLNLAKILGLIVPDNWFAGTYLYVKN